MPRLAGRGGAATRCAGGRHRGPSPRTSDTRHYELPSSMGGESTEAWWAALDDFHPARPEAARVPHRRWGRPGSRTRSPPSGTACRRRREAGSAPPPPIGSKPIRGCRRRRRRPASAAVPTPCRFRCWRPHPAFAQWPSSASFAPLIVESRRAHAIQVVARDERRTHGHLHPAEG
jgi:hypothetical protein